MSQALTFEMKPEWAQIEEARQRCDSFLISIKAGAQVRESVCMIVSEFLENAIKYGNFGDGSTIPLSMKAVADGVIIEVRNPLPLSESGQDLRRLDALVQWIRSFHAPFQVYLEKLRQVADRPMDDNESGLGLVRIAYEGEAMIDFYVDENDCLTMSALKPF